VAIGTEANHEKTHLRTAGIPARFDLLILGLFNNVVSTTEVNSFERDENIIMNDEWVQI
jgi:hypothetical protein